MKIGRFEVGRGARLQLAEGLLQRGGVDVAGGREKRANVVAAEVRDRKPERRENAAHLRDEDRPHPELLGERARVDRARAAEGNERELARIESTLDADHAKRPHHLGVRHVDDAERRLERVHAELAADALERLLRDALPAGAELALEAEVAEPALFEPSLPAVRASARALERACPRPPVLIRNGGTLPILAAFAERGIPAIVSGFGLPADNIHAPDESFRLESLELGLRSEALYEELGDALR
jgi:hypothetical protein